MFGVKQTITSALHPVFSNAQRRLPEAHHRAQAAGLNHLHDHAIRAAEEAGFSAEPLVVHWRAGAGYIAIDHTEEGDRLADNEFGHPDRDPNPNPVIRNAMSAAHSQASAIYRGTLRSEMGF